MDKVINFSAFFENTCVIVIFVIVAVLFSILNGCDGVRDLVDGRCKQKGNPCRNIPCVQKISYFFSDFFSSLIGWSAFYLLLSRVHLPLLGIFEIFLGIVAIAGITGHGYRLADWLSKKE